MIARLGFPVARLASWITRLLGELPCPLSSWCRPCSTCRRCRFHSVPCAGVPR